MKLLKTERGWLKWLRDEKHMASTTAWHPPEFPCYGYVEKQAVAYLYMEELQNMQVELAAAFLLVAQRRGLFRRDKQTPLKAVK